MTSTPAKAEPHVRAVVELLDAGLQALPVPAPIHAYNGERKGGDRRCVVVYGDPGQPSGSLGDRYSDIQITLQVTAVGEGPEQAAAYADDARALLLTDTPPAVAGRHVLPLWQIAQQPVRRDDKVMPPLWIATAQYAIKSTPA